ncbi:MAG: DegT/DnrJ/EryC1/StrS family aminotransferase [Muribaculaceae bacterium]|nr:DegT/DnrJ/EryC1/StrS family aminotransferase [Muribaculaceae bacterium]
MDTTKRYPFLDLAIANAPFMDELKAAACEVIERGRYLHSTQTDLLEQEIAATCGARHCVGVSNGLDALRLILRAYKEMGIISEGDEVIVPANTYVASVLAISDNSLVPVLCEPRVDTMNLDSSRLESLITPRTRAIMPVHLYGTPCWDETLMRVAHENGLRIIEDNAQAIGALSDVPGLNGTCATGGLGDAAGISFYPTKNLGALGDGGAIVTNDDELAVTVRALANYGSDRRYHNIYQGYNCRLDEIQAAMLRVKLRYLDRENDNRAAVARAYASHISNPRVHVPAIFEGMKQTWHQYVVRVEDRDAFRSYLDANGVGTDIHYATPAHKQPCYQGLEHVALPVTERLADEVVSLPIAHPITPEDAIAIADIINRF